MEPKTNPKGPEVNRPYSAGPMLPQLPQPPKKPDLTGFYMVPAEFYDVVKADPNRWEENEIVGVVAGATAVFIAALLIFMPVQGIERQSSFSSGLTLFGAGIGYALRSVQKK